MLLNENKKDSVNVEELKELKVLSEQAVEVSVSSLWNVGPVILIFVRHFSCIACRAHVLNIWSQKKRIEESNIRIIFVGSGSPSAIKSFKEDLKITDALIYTDPSLKTFDACGLKRSLGALLNPKGVKKFMELREQGHKQGSWSFSSGSHTQMGGVIAMKPPGKVVYHFVSNYLGDEDDLSDIPSM